MASSAATAARTAARQAKAPKSTPARTTGRNGKAVKPVTTAKPAPEPKPETPKVPTKAERREEGKKAIAASIATFEQDPPADGLLPLLYLLVNGDFIVHAPTCKSVITDFMKSDYQAPADMAAASARDAVLELWDDQISESDVIADHDNPTEDELSVYYGATSFHSCVKFPGETNGNTAKRDAKHLLARTMITAMGDAFDNMDPKVMEALGGREAAGAIASAWVHHLPTGDDEGKRIWPTEHLPRPDRSDWR